ncbi:MAG TPA: Flp family type IVb pilin [Actinomycetes bacterium]|nr:Flp family type IVb pilin [Actinomycetes bacterium]
MTDPDEGASAIEYGLLLVAIAVVVMTVVYVLGRHMDLSFQGACENLATEMTGGATTTCSDP